MSQNRPPKLFDRFFCWFCRKEELEVMRGDLYELYEERLEEKGPFRANLMFCLEVLDLCRPFVLKRRPETQTTIMFKTFFKITYRNFIRQKVYSLLNVSGLAIGLTCFMLIFLYIQDELSYDKMHGNSDRIYRVLEHFESEGVGEHSASQPFPVGPTLKNDFPRQVEEVVRLFNFQSPTLAMANKQADKAFNESKIFFADSSFLKVFEYELLEGDRATALDEPNSVLITPTMARKYFGNADPIGQLLEFQGQQNLQVTGILEDSPLNAHFQYDFIVSFSSLRFWYGGNYPGTWYWNPCWTYILLEENTTPEQLALQFPDFVEKYFPDFIKEDVTLELQPLENIHLYSRLDYEIQANSNAKNIYIFGAIAIFVLIIAAINFINLSTARATKRAKEVGVRKSLGSAKGQLITQFVFESVVMTFLAVIIAAGVVTLLLPAFNVLVEKAFALDALLQLRFVIGAISLALIVGLLSGFYPAFVLSSFRPVSVLKGGLVRTQGMGFRKILVTAQFAISIFLIAGTFIGIQQFNLLQDQETGFDQDHVIMVPVIRSPMGQHYETFRNSALQSPHISSMTGVEEIIGAKHQVGNYRFEGMERSKPFPRFFVLPDYTETMDIELVAGRDYSRDFLTDDSLGLVVNESMVQAMGWGSAEEALNKRFYYRNELRGKVLGVVKDYNFVSKHHQIAPLVLDLNRRPGAFNLFIKYLAVKVDGRNLQAALGELENSWKASLPNRPFDFFFLEDRLNDSYKAEQKLSKITIIFSVLAILVACLGLFGLATFSIERRTKEIGLRKVLGIKTGQIMVLLSKEFVLLILIAFVVSIPSSYYFLERWLEGFAYRISIEAWPFLAAGALTLLVALFTILYHALKASLINPVESLRYE